MTPRSTFKLEVFQTADAVNIAAAEFIIATASRAIIARGRFILSLSGGQTPGNLYKLLAEPAYNERMPWKDTFIFWGDERCVPLNDERNNAHQAKVLLLDKIGIPLSNVHRVPVDLSPAEAALQYEKEISVFFGEEPIRFDLILLGLGENGHTASLFPGSEVVFENNRLIRNVFVAEQNMFRITMTPLLINKARNIIFLVEGENKAEILKSVLNGSQQPDKFPAQVIHAEKGNLYWFVDKKAAALLPAYMSNSVI